MRRGSFRQRLSKQPAQERAIHLHHVWKIEIEDIANRLFHNRMIPPDVEHAVTAQKIQVRLIIHVVQVRAFRSRIDLVEPDHSLRLHQRRVYVSLVELVILAQSRRDNFLQIKSHPVMFCDLHSKRKRNAMSNASSYWRQSSIYYMTQLTKSRGIHLGSRSF